jgi:uncharacterized repeat protein (TIGR01451 family)
MRRSCLPIIRLFTGSMLALLVALWIGRAVALAAPTAQQGEPLGTQPQLANRTFLPIVFSVADPSQTRKVDIEYQSGLEFLPLDGSIVPSTTLTVRIRLTGALTGVSVQLAAEASPAQDITGQFPQLESSGGANALLALQSGVYTLTVNGSSAGQPISANARTLLMASADGVTSAAIEFPTITAADEEGNLVAFEDQTVLLLFGPGASLTEIGAFLAQNSLSPLDWTGPLGLVRARIHSGQPPGTVAAALIGLHPDLIAATVNREIDDRDAAGERIPAPISAAYRTDGNANCSAAGNDWRGCIEHTGTVTSTARVFRQHFFMDSFAGHRLVQKLLPNNPISAGLAIVDGGLGNGVNVNADIPTANLFGFSRAPWSFSADSGEQSGGPFTLANVADGGGHGTSVSAVAAARGATVLGSGPDISVRPMRSGDRVSRITGIVGAVIHPRVQAVNASWGWTGPTAGQRALITSTLSLASWPFLDWGPDRTAGTGDAGEGDRTFTFTDTSGNGRHDAGEASERFFDGNGNGRYDADDGRIVVMAMDNVYANHGLNSLPDGYAPSGIRSAASYLAMGVCSVDTQDLIRGPERYPTGTAFGPNKSVSAHGERVILPNQNGVLREISGCSFAAPIVAGLVTEMRMLDRNLNPDAANLLTPLQIIEIVAATADDLGTTNSAAVDQLRANDAPGNGFDLHFGNGRVNIWKAMLALVNRGVASESHAAVGRSPATNFPSLATIAEEKTRWYGFKMHSPLHGATVWIDGVQVTDAGSTAPGGVNAYAGVRNDRTILIGVDPDGDGRLDEDPTSGVVPIGGKSEFLITFSIERGDLVKAGGRRTLSLRRPGQLIADAPFYNLELDLNRMRRNEMPGVFFDDFVFEVMLPDFGDASVLSPLIQADNGPQHVNTILEYFGKMNNSGAALEGVSPEQQVFSFNDVDGVGNWGIDLEDLDGRDNGITFYPLTYLPNGKGRADFRVCVAANGVRYDKVDRNKQVYVNGWIDWNTNGALEEGASREHVLNGLRLAPVSGAAADWEPIIAAGEAISATVTRLASNDNCGEYKALFDLPAAIGKGKLEARWRIDYGENVGRHTNSTFQHMKGLDLAAGPARFGEVEDYTIGPDFGDAPDGPYPTKKGSNGPRHLSFYREWIGPFNSGDPTASREPNACATQGSDQDGSDNLGAGCLGKDLDGFDNFTVAIIAPGKIKVDFDVSAAVAGYGFDGGNAGVTTLKPDCKLLPMSGTPDTPLHQRVAMRYDAANPEERLYVNLWADWNADGVFEAHLIGGAPVDAEDFGADGGYTLGEQFVDANKDGVWNPSESFTDAAGMPTRHFSCEFAAPVPPPPGIEQWLRLRVDYGENEGQFIRHGDAFEEEPLHVPAAYTGGAVWGEVEDTPLRGGPRKRSTPATVKPKETIHYTLIVPGNPMLSGSSSGAVNGAAVGTIDDPLPDLVEFVDGTLTASSGKASYDPATHTVEWEGELTASSEVVVEFDVTVVENPPLDWPKIVNRATVYDGVTFFTVETTTKLQCVPVKRPSISAVTVGQVFSYTIALPNVASTGPVQATIQDVLPQWMQLVGEPTCTIGICSADISPDASIVTWNGTLAPEQQVLLTFGASIVLPREIPPSECPPVVTNHAIVFDGVTQQTVSGSVELTCVVAPTAR